MAEKLTRLTHKIAIQLHLVAESCTISSSRSRRPVRKLVYLPYFTILSEAFAKSSVTHNILQQELVTPTPKPQDEHCLSVL
jgi:hypothetical protein